MRPPATPAASAISPAALAVTTLWRLAVSAAGFAGAFLGLNGASGLRYLSPVSALLVGIYFLAEAVLPFVWRGHLDEPDPFVRMSVIVLSLITGVVYNTLMSGDLNKTWSLFAHAIVPLMVAVDWCAFGRNQVRTRVWHALALPAIPLLYLFFALTQHNAEGEALYSFLNTSSSEFGPFIVGSLIGVIVVGFAMWGIGRLRASMGNPARA